MIHSEFAITTMERKLTTVVIDGFVYPASIIDLFNSSNTPAINLKYGHVSPIDKARIEPVLKDFEALRAIVDQRMNERMKDFETGDLMLYGTRPNYVSITNSQETKRIAAEILAGRVDIMVRPLSGPAKFILEAINKPKL